VSPWAKFSDGFDKDYRIANVSLEAAGLFTRAVTMTADRLTDGWVDARWLRQRVPGKKTRERILGELVTEGLFRPAGGDGGFLVVPVIESDTDRLVLVSKKQAVLEYRKKDAAKKRAARKASAALESEKPTDVPPGHDRGRPGGVPGYGSGVGAGSNNSSDEGDQLRRGAGARSEAIAAESGSVEADVRRSGNGFPVTSPSAVDEEASWARALEDAGKRS
jgi:hypothetical protein